MITCVGDMRRARWASGMAHAHGGWSAITDGMGIVSMARCGYCDAVWESSRYYIAWDAY